MPVTDLEKLIRNRQDQLRGRPRDWRDDLIDWYARQDWHDNLIEAAMVIGVLISCIPLIAVGLIMIFGE